MQPGKSIERTYPPDNLCVIDLYQLSRRSAGTQCHDHTQRPDPAPDGGWCHQSSRSRSLENTGVPSVFADGKLIHVGRGDFGELLSKLEEQYGVEQSARESSIRKYDVIVVGGGPAGSAAAIYSARKGLNVAVIAERIGGQVKETVGIENLISVPSTTGSQLADNLKTHMAQYPIDLLEHRRLESSSLKAKTKCSQPKGRAFLCSGSNRCHRCKLA